LSDPVADLGPVTALGVVKAQIFKAAHDAGRDPASVTLVAVSKHHGVEAILSVLNAGQRVFGENKVQEALMKFPALKEQFPDLELHGIGPLQTNKVRDAVGLFDVIETVDRPKLARVIADEMERIGRRPKCLIQVNTGHEPQKAGIEPEQADRFIQVCVQEYNLPITGLMCIPPAGIDPAGDFKLLGEIATRNGLPVLSMGMSSDYAIAIAHGATHVRVGTAIFGTRYRP